MAKRKRNDRPKHVSIYYDQILYDLDFMPDEYAGIILKMIVWYASGTKEGEEHIAQMKERIDTLHDKGWLTGIYKRLFRAIDEDLQAYADQCEKQRKRIQDYWDRKNSEVNNGIPRNTTVNNGIPTNTTVNNGIPTNTITDTDTDTDTELSNDNINKEEEEEDAREDKKSEALEALSLDSFCELWNGAIARAKRKRDVVAMKPIARANLPSDAQERIGKALGDIGGWLDDQTRQRLFRACKVRQDASEEDLAKWYMLVAMNRLSEASIKPRDSSFGSFNWFVNYPRRIKKLFDGDIM